ncbi:MAG TPA: 1-deoxy-D-xylulose-5-phosphate synthase [Dehalococcoidia bacterium]|nr:1-deoxy-D-xylulose-5-phosphate synthase [Dehalococcoidia bacterium]
MTDETTALSSTPLLDRVQRPQDLHAMTHGELEALAEEIRAELVRVVFETGGHLASNLGTVELTIALHSLLDSPRDKIVWDVGHQAYVHKLLTGRRDRFETIRQWEGLTPFCERDESEHDVWGAGHASTSLSAATGMAIARDLQGDDYNVVAVIGDGGLTGGMALEAINHIGHLGKRLIVVFNDNGMSIAPNVGAINRVFNKIRLDARYHFAKSSLGQIARKMPLGDTAWEASRRVKRSVKGMLMPSMLFEQLGFDYIGPVDGHDIGELRAALQTALQWEAKPVFIHAITQKGHGYAPAEADPVKLHGVSPAGGGSGGPPKYQDVFGAAVSELMRRDKTITAITAAMPDGTGLVKTMQEFPDRTFDVGICEQHGVTLAAGMATQGLTPIVAIYSTFLQRAYDQIIHDVCVQNLHVVFALDRAGFVGDDGRTHQGAFDLSYLSCIPNMVVSVPKDEQELRDLLFTGVEHSGPFALRYPRGAGTGVELRPGFQPIPIGSWEVLRAGDDVAIIACGAAVQPALSAAEELAEHGVSAAVLNARFVKPLDTELLLDYARRMRARHLLTIEENVVRGGLGSAVAVELQKAGLAEVKLECIGMPDRFVEHGSQKIQRARYGVTAAAIVQRLLSATPEAVPAS